MNFPRSHLHSIPRLLRLAPFCCLDGKNLLEHEVEAKRLAFYWWTKYTELNSSSSPTFNDYKDRLSFNLKGVMWKGGG